MHPFDELVLEYNDNNIKMIKQKNKIKMFKNKISVLKYTYYYEYIRIMTLKNCM